MRMPGSFKVTIAAALLAVLPRLEARAAEAGEPAVRPIQNFYAVILDTMKRGKELGIEGRFKRIAPAVDAAFDLPGMTRLSVGPAWNTLSETDRAAIVEAFRRMTIANYAKSFASFGGEEFVTVPSAKSRNEDKIVETKLIGADKAVTPFNYRMHMEGDSWKVLDVYLNGYVSQLALRRSDYSSTVANSGAAGLAKKINDLADKQLAGG